MAQGSGAEEDENDVLVDWDLSHDVAREGSDLMADDRDDGDDNDDEMGGGENVDEGTAGKGCLAE